MFVGGSWGATLALLYAKKYPESVLALNIARDFSCKDPRLRVVSV